MSFDDERFIPERFFWEDIMTKRAYRNIEGAREAIAMLREATGDMLPDGMTAVWAEAAELVEQRGGEVGFSPRETTAVLLGLSDDEWRAHLARIKAAR